MGLLKRTISGIRGIFGEDFMLRDALEFASNFSSLITSGKCVIGRDTRPSGQMVKNAVKASLMGNGIDVFDLGTAATPVVFREARKYGSGIVISSSHNPIEWNGMKFIINGRGINEEELPQITEHQEFSPSAIGNEFEISSTYVEDAERIVGRISGNKPEVVVDIGGGAAGMAAPQLLEKIGCKVTAINKSPDNSSRGPDPTTDDLIDLCAISKNGRLGFAFDLDGDRLVLVSDGKKQTPDVTLGLGVAKSLELGCRNFVLSIDTSVAVEKFIREEGGTIQRSKVGEANVVDLMLKTGAQAGGEGSSGGFILPGFNYCRDGILAAGLIASMQERYKVLDRMSGYSQIREKVYVDSDLHNTVIEQLLPKFESEFSETITLDGLKGIVDEDSWLLIRKSNTEDAIRVSGESKNMERCRMIVNNGARLVRESSEQIR